MICEGCRIKSTTNAVWFDHDLWQQREKIVKMVQISVLRQSQEQFIISRSAVHRITQSQQGWSWQGPLAALLQPLLRQGHAEQGAQSRGLLKILKEGDPTASMGSLCPCSYTCTAKQCFYIPKSWLPNLCTIRKLCLKNSASYQLA